MLALSWQLPFLHSARAGDFALSLDAKTLTKMRDVFHIVVLIVSAREQGSVGKRWVSDLGATEFPLSLYT